MNPSSGSTEELFAAVKEFQERRRSGEPLSADEFAARFPQLQTQLHGLLQTAQAMDTAVTTDQPIPKHERLGEYRLLREVGRGGMGVVYEAIQESLGRRVAIKLLSRDDGAMAERFQREARIAARLHHTNIVPVHSVGSEGGQPFYVMQFIDGKSLQAWRAERRCEPREVARLGLQAAEALAYAHGQGVMHRDLKPANFLLDTKGTVWIADFGLAKAADDLDLTGSGDLIGTVRYMAPERFSGQCDGRSDLYSLGATLYELLTGRLAFDAAEQPALVEQVTRATPTAPRKIDPSIPRDLETIVMKALAREPSARYATAADLAEDLRRYLGRQPVVARPPGPIERLGKWAKRNPAWAALVAVVFASLVTVAIYSLQLRTALGEAKTNLTEAHSQNQRAEDNLKSLQEAVGRFVDLVEKDPKLAALDLSDTRKQLFASAIGFYDIILAQSGNDPAILNGLAKTCGQLANVLYANKQYPEARQVSEREAELYSRLVQSHPEETRYRLALSGAKNNLGYSYLQQGNSKQGEPHLRQAVEISRDALARDRSHAGLRQFLAIQLHTLGACREEANDFADAGKLNDEAAELMREAVKENASDAHAFNILANTLLGRANLLGRAGNNTEAELAYRDGLEAGRASVRLAPQNTAYSRQLMSNAWQFSSFLRRMGRMDESAAAMNEAVDITDLVLAGQSTNLQTRLDVARLYTRFAIMKREGGNLDEALTWHDRARDVLKDDDVVNIRAPLLKSYVQYVFEQRAQSLAELGRHAEAVLDIARASSFAVPDDAARLNLLQLAALARSGDTESALKLVPDSAADEKLPAAKAALLARGLSLIAGRLPANDPRREANLERASKLLNVAVQGKAIDAKRLAVDPEFELLRDRPGFPVTEASAIRKE